jgi:hypothetical protein
VETAGVVVVRLGIIIENRSHVEAVNAPKSESSLDSKKPSLRSSSSCRILSRRASSVSPG